MKKITIIGPWEKWQHGWVLPANSKASGAFLHITDREDMTVTVEDVVDPLPTKTSTVFWGQTREGTPQWWFVRRDRLNSNRVVYVPEFDYNLTQEEAESFGLTVLDKPND